MSGVILDTHALIWLMDEDPSLGPRARALADGAMETDSLAVSAITFWETAMLASRNRIRLAPPLARWRRSVLDLGVREIPVTGDIGIEAVSLGGYHADPADRIVAATAIREAAVLITADRRILAWAGTLKRQDARI